MGHRSEHESDSAAGKALLARSVKESQAAGNEGRREYQGRSPSINTQPPTGAASVRENIMYSRIRGAIDLGVIHLVLLAVVGLGCAAHSNLDDSEQPTPPAEVVDETASEGALSQPLGHSNDWECYDSQFKWLPHQPSGVCGGCKINGVYPGQKYLDYIIECNNNHWGTPKVWKSYCEPC